MATGDATDFVARLRAALPRRWFPDTSPVLAAVLAGLAWAWAELFTLWGFVIQQCRISSATGEWLDFIAADFFGPGIRRLPSESDASFRVRIRAEMLRERGTRASIISALRDLTGRTPIVAEPAWPGSAGGYGTAAMILGTGLGYGVAGHWGSLLLPFEFFVTAYRPEGEGVASVAGYYYGSGWAGGGYGVGAIQWISDDMFRAAITDADIYDVVNRTRPAGTIAWVQITE